MVEIKQIGSGAVLASGQNYQLAVKSAQDEGRHMEGGQFFKLDLRETDFELAHLKNANFYLADLRGVNFRGADLTGVNFRSANLAGANLDNACIDGANFEGAILTDTCLYVDSDESTPHVTYQAPIKSFKRLRNLQLIMLAVQMVLVTLQAIQIFR